MIPKNNPVAVYEEYNTEILVNTISGDINGWIDTYVTIAQSRMMKKHGADAILSVTSEATTNENGQLVVTVRGFPVKYINFRPASEKDLWMLEFEKSSTKTIFNEGPVKKETKSSETIIK